LLEETEMAVGKLLSVNVGLPREISWNGNTVRTAIWKEAVEGRRKVRRLNIDGDGQGDLLGHGGEQRAVFVYQIDSYRYWQRQLGRDDFTFGQFGENFTVDGLGDDEVCIGDRYRIGTALFEVTQPRVTCYRVGIRMSEPRMPALLVSHRRPGFYLRVLEEGQVEAGDAIVRVSTGPEEMTVAEADGLLYLPRHPRHQLERALRIPALSPGWQGSFRALLESEIEGRSNGNPGLAPPAGPPPAWPGFRSLRIARVDRESSTVISLTLEATDAVPLPPFLPGQFVVLRLKPAPAVPAILRSYSLSGASDAGRYRVSVKLEAGGAAGAYLHLRARPGDVLDVSAPRGAFTLVSGEGPVVLISAGVGATPVLAMLHALASEGSRRETWWLHGARNGSEHPFAGEVRRLLRTHPAGRGHVSYSTPGPGDRPGLDFDSAGRLTPQVLDELGVRDDADFYVCGPPTFMADMSAGLAARGVAAHRIRTEVFGSTAPITPGVIPTGSRRPHPPAGGGGSGPSIAFARSGLTVRWDAVFGSLLDLAEACDVPVRWSCRTGVCHTCESGLLGGSVRYGPQPLEAPGEGNVLICCSQPVNSDLVIDL
jgi:ferredoxin-NADP reductase/MOSC domain-containing protein YiiM